MELRDGTTLNNLLFQIFDVDPAVARSGRAKTPLSASCHPGNPVRVGLRGDHASASTR